MSTPVAWTRIHYRENCSPQCAFAGCIHSIAYSYLLNLSYDRAHWQGFFLYTSTVAVMVKGRNLQKVVEAIRLHTCEYIQEFDPASFKTPPGPDEPFIELMQVEVVGPGMNLFADSDDPKKKPAR